MPVFKTRSTAQIARNLSAFVSLEAGVVRGPAPPAQAPPAQAPPAQAPPARPAGWHRQAIGGMWEEIGALQFEFLVERGLKPEHFLLDIGCGSLRGGVRFVSHLDPGRYHGVDRAQSLLDAGAEELEKAGLKEKRASLAVMEDFGFERLGQTFDFAIAQSVFTHLSLNSITRCLINADRVLRPGGTLYATFFENEGGKHSFEPIERGDGFVSRYDKDPFHYVRDDLTWACESTGLAAEYIGDWNHPRGQVMMAFTKTG